MEKLPRCHRCLKELAVRIPVARKEVCPSCGCDLRCCLNCGFHAPGTYNECREPQAERVIDKERSNFCDYFVLVSGAGGGQAPKADTAREKLASLFK
jgi:hypothetical protein